MISQQHAPAQYFEPHIITKTSPMQLCDDGLSPGPISMDSIELKLLDRYNGPGSVESARSSTTDQSSSDNTISLVRFLGPPKTSPSFPSLKEDASCSLIPSGRDFVGELRCAVCQDSASGIHYNVVSCNGCKTFFRRTVVTGRKFVCKNDGNCLFDKNKRCSCRACRWTKCLSVGMNAQAIQYTPSANLTLSIARKRFQRSLRTSTSRSGAGSFQLPCKLSINEQESILQCIDQVLHLDEKFDRLRSSTFCDHDPSLRLNDLLNRHSTIADANKYPIVERWPQRLVPVEVNDLKKMQKLGLKFWFYHDLYLSVEYIKTLPIFQHLKTQDKYQLLFSAVLKDTYISSSYYSYNKRADEIVYPDGWAPFQQKNNSSLLEIEKVIRRGVVPEMNDLKPDQIQYSLLRAICSLDFACSDLSEEGQEVVARECSRYTIALLRYLQNKHGTQLGIKRFSESLSFLAMLVRKIKNNYDYYAFKRYVLQVPAPSTMFSEIMTKNIIAPSD